MDTNEIVALLIVVVASLLVVRYFMRKKGGSCCSSGCLPGSRPKFEKKDKDVKLGDEK